MLVGIFGFLWFYKLEGVIALAVCFVYIFEDNIFFYLQFTDDEVMITWWFCSAESSGVDKSELNFLAAKYVVNLIIYCFFPSDCWNILVCCYELPCCYIGSSVLKGCVADEEIVDWAEIDEMLLIVIWNTTSKTSNTIITGMLFDFFPYFSVPVPS